jgi:hypothetical protein
VRNLISRLMWPRRLKRIIKIIVKLVILAALAYAAWRWRHLWMPKPA